MKRRYCIIYRMGGKENFTWNRSLAFDDRKEAESSLNEVLKMGYKAFIENYDLSVLIGLPETYDYE